MNARELGLTQANAAHIAEISERSGQRIDAGEHRPNRGVVPEVPPCRDPLAGVWEQELEPMLQREPRLKPMTLFEYLQEKYPGQYPQVLRTLQRRVRTWKALHGPAPEVMFELRHEPGEMGLSDFTELKGIEITINGAPFEHLLYHYRLAYSGWRYAQIIQGGESFVALSEGLQNALFACDGAPKQHRTDSLSAAYRNLSGGSKRLTQLYDELCEHYRLMPTRNNKGIAHENGAIESPHGHLKNRIKQAIYLRGGSDFASVGEYQQLIDQVVAALNRQRQSKFEQEKSALQRLPKMRVADYELLSARVSSRSTIEVRCILYSVPSRLIGHQVEIHLHHDRLIGYLGRHQVFEMPRIRVKDKRLRRGRCIDYRHLIEGLRRKPQAFLYCSWQEDLLPNTQFQSLWQHLRADLEADRAAVLMVEALYIAATQDKEQAVAEYLESALANRQLSLAALQQHFALTATAQVPPIDVTQHALEGYDQLLSSTTQPDTDEQSGSCPPAQTAQTLSPTYPLGLYRSPGPATTLVLWAILVQDPGARSPAPQRCPPQEGTGRGSATQRKKFFHL